VHENNGRIFLSFYLISIDFWPHISEIKPAIPRARIGRETPSPILPIQAVCSCAWDRVGLVHTPAFAHRTFVAGEMSFSSMGDSFMAQRCTVE